MGFPFLSSRKVKDMPKFYRERNIWRTMCNRCHNPNATAYRWYGARGITVHDEWRASFEKFLEHVGPSPGDHYSIDRIDNSRGYMPGNVRWTTRDEQNRNKRPRKKPPKSHWYRRSTVQLLEAHEFLTDPLDGV